MWLSSAWISSADEPLAYYLLNHLFIHAEGFEALQNHSFQLLCRDIAHVAVLVAKTRISCTLIIVVETVPSGGVFGRHVRAAIATGHQALKHKDMFCFLSEIGPSGQVPFQCCFYLMP